MSRRNIDAMLSAESDEHGTPRRLFESLHHTFGFNLDAAASKRNALLPIFITEGENSLRRTWSGTRFWLNFPYSQAAAFTKKSREEAQKPGTLGVLLSPVRPDTDWWRKYVLQLDGGAGHLRDSHFTPENWTFWFRFDRLIVGVRHVKGRLTFRPPPGKPPQAPAPFPSATIIMANPHIGPPVLNEWTHGWPL